MNYDVRRPTKDDRKGIDNLLIEDYRKSGLTKQPLRDDQMHRYSQEAWIALNEQGMPEAIALMGIWKPGDAVSFPEVSSNTDRLTDRLKWRGRMFLDKGAFLLSAVDYNEGGALTALVDTQELLTPPALGSIHVPLLEAEQAAHTFLSGRGFQDSAYGEQELFGESVQLVLMSRSGWLRNRLLNE
jgi:hypothetical protein